MRATKYLAVLLGWLTVAATAGASPALEAAAPIHDFGIVAPGERLEHAFALRNTGAAALHLRRVAAVCGCTVARYDETIAPDSTGEVRAAVDTTTFRFGPFQKTVEVETDDAAMPRLTLTLRGDLQPHVAVAPNRLRWTVAADGSGADTQTLLVTSAHDALDLEVTAVEPSESFLRATFRELERGANQRRWQIAVSLAAERPAGALRGELRIHTNHPSQPIVAVPVSGFVAN